MSFPPIRKIYDIILCRNDIVDFSFCDLFLDIEFIRMCDLLFFRRQIHIIMV